MEPTSKAHSAGVPFSEVATYKSLSLLRVPKLTRSHPTVILTGESGINRPATGARMLTPAQGPAVKTDLPSINNENLQAKQEELRKLERCLEKAVMSEKRAQKRSEQDMKLIELHHRRAVEAGEKIKGLQEKLPMEERTGNKRFDAPLGHTTGWGPDASGRWAPGFPNQRISPGAAMLTRAPASLASSPPRRSFPPLTQIVMIPMPDQSTKRPPDNAELSHSASAPAIVQAPIDSPKLAKSKQSRLEDDEEEVEDPLDMDEASPASTEIDDSQIPTSAGGSAGDRSDGFRTTMGSGRSFASSHRQSRAQFHKALSRQRSRVADPSSQGDDDSHSGTELASGEGRTPRSIVRSNSMASHAAGRKVFADEGSPWRLPSRASATSMDEEVDLPEVQREAIRAELMYVAGGGLEAFRCIDLSGSGKISLQEFGDGIHRLGLRWREVTGLKKPRELFKLFDQDRDGIVTLPDLFPEERLLKEDAHRMSTPEWWGHWCRKNKDFDADAGQSRGPKWHFNGPEEELQILWDAAQTRQDVAQRRRWMSSTMRRMKGQGKSDARCRECCALHLPRGTGPKDREDVSTFTKNEVKTCKRAYNDEVNTPARNIQKTVYEMREQRRVLQNSRLKLWTVTGQEQAHRMRKEQELQKSMANLKLSLRGPKEEGDDSLDDGDFPDIGGAFRAALALSS